jgi:hypothetical protein
VAAQGQVIDAVEEDRQPVGLRHADDERVDASLQRMLEEETLGDLRERPDLELLVRRVDERADPVAKGDGSGARPRQDENAIGRDAPGRERGDAPGESLAAAAAGAAEDQQRPLAVLGNALLLGRRLEPCLVEILHALQSYNAQ